jgi:hypothetical protein
MAVVTGDPGVISQVQDQDGTCTFHLDVNADAFGSTHNGIIFFDGPATIASANDEGSNGEYDAHCIGNQYIWHTQCNGGFFGGAQYVHYVITVTYTMSDQAREGSIKRKVLREALVNSAVR